MGKFKFENTDIKLEIEDHIFYVDLYSDEVTSALTDVMAVAEKLSKQDITYKEAVEGIVNSIGKILGEGSIEKIFGDKPPKMIHVMQLASYLTQEFDAQRVDLTKSFYIPEEK